MTDTVKGNQIKLALAFLKENFGNNAFEKIKQQLDPEIGEILSRPILDISRVPEKAYIQLLITAEKVFGTGDNKVCHDIGHYLALKSVPTFYQIFIKLGDPFFVIKRSASFWKNVHSSGTLTFKPNGPNSTIGKLVGFAYPCKEFCESLLGYFEGICVVCGYKPKSAIETKCVTEGADSCEYIFEWE
ncbi:MAG: hypothetical protein GY858_04660 [Candidatus Omnitrophica bacterium]|nr:hypothetical protein [Candidatus Omnitrophota bacterium]